MPGITLLGLGPGNPRLLTGEAREVLESTPEIYLRTRQHPVVDALPSHVQLFSFDELYEQHATFESLYSTIVEKVLELGRRPGGVVYAVPGHPFVAEATCPVICQRAEVEGLAIRVVEGLSFLEPTITLLRIDPFPHTALVDALELLAAHTPPFPPSVPAIVAQIHSRAVAAELKLTLMAVYPDAHPVRLVHSAGMPDAHIEDIPLFEIDRSQYIGLLTSLYLPPLNPALSFEAFQETVARLRAPDGCPWDREQTHQSLRPYLLEEAYEAIAALDADDPVAMREEFGDLLLQIMLHAQIASEYGEFNMADVLQGIHTKIVQRHPHVFGDLDLKDVDGVLRNWERLKADERAANGKRDTSLLDGVALVLPALAQAGQYQSRAARVGFDWTDLQGVIQKVIEELNEVQSASTAQERDQELGDLLFAVVNLARWYDTDAETALREANARFRARFIYMETTARVRGRSLSDLTMDELDALWRIAKQAGGATPEA
ncbi:MAG: nucleoside triphosphate pyrophosphohydrolase [Chloroflexi bacterium RBG_16_52_11]|nr:MAG: nucleoside triphosphate pyrophosphohydrolase [Chloroflexi bacterium RBG_16_52_11]